jgi:hypothetical protein
MNQDSKGAMMHFLKRKQVNPIMIADLFGFEM